MVFKTEAMPSLKILTSSNQIFVWKCSHGNCSRNWKYLVLSEERLKCWKAPLLCPSILVNLLNTVLLPPHHDVWHSVSFLRRSSETHNEKVPLLCRSYSGSPGEEEIHFYLNIFSYSVVWNKISQFLVYFHLVTKQ